MSEPLLTVSELARAVGKSTDSIRNAIDHLDRTKVKRDATGRVRIRARLSDVMHVYRDVLEDRGWT